MKITNADKLTTIFGNWLSFHDATIKRVKFNDISPCSVVTTIHVFRMTQEVNEKGFFVLQNHTLATLRFREITELIAEIPASGMLLFGLTIRELSDDSGELFAVDFEDAIGDDFTLRFNCRKVEVMSVHACDFRGQLI